ncbi:hypothetical protein ACRAWF_45655 [Streptomyces sp. L7]
MFKRLITRSHISRFPRSSDAVPRYGPPAPRRSRWRFNTTRRAISRAAALLNFYVAGTVATPQTAYADFGLTTPLPNPLVCDQSGRVPLHWLADGLIHVRLTDSAGGVIVDNTLQVLGPSSGGGRRRRHRRSDRDHADRDDHVVPAGLARGPASSAATD